MKIASIINWIYDNRSRLFTFLIRCHAKRDESNRMDMFFDEVLGGFNSLSCMDVLRHVTRLLRPTSDNTVI